MISEVTNFDVFSKGDVLVDFYTSSCAPCKALNPILEELSKEFSTLRIAKVDVTENPEVSQQFGIMSVPTVIFMRNNQVKQVIRGLSTKETLKKMIKACSAE